MALTFTELESITNDYFKADNKKAVDIYFNDSFLLDWLMNKKKGLWERPAGGERIRVPLSYDGQEGGFYSRSDALSSDDRESINAAFFEWKHAYGNATIYRTDEQKNAGEYAEVQLVVQKIEGAQKTARKFIASNLYAEVADTSKTITGLRSMTSETATNTYGNLAENDLVAADGTKPWEGKTTVTDEAITLDVIRDLASLAKIGDGPGGKPDIGTMPETLFNTIVAILQVQQRFKENTEVKAGFTHVYFEGKTLAADDYCPAGYLFLNNTNHMGFGIHQKGYFVRTPWANLLAANVVGRSLKILWDGNIICSNRKSHAAHSNLT